MNLFALAKLFKALFLFVREMWLRDRTFRQFVRENMPFILVSVGFVVMTLLFINVYFIVKDQERELLDHEHRYAITVSQHEKQVEALRGRVTTYQEKYLQVRTDYELLKQDPRLAQGTAPKKPSPPTKEPANPTRTPPNNNLVDRWKKLNQ